MTNTNEKQIATAHALVDAAHGMVMSEHSGSQQPIREATAIIAILALTLAKLLDVVPPELLQQLADGGDANVVLQ
jgi:hypothetical protein